MICLKTAIHNDRNMLQQWHIEVKGVVVHTVSPLQEVLHLSEYKMTHFQNGTRYSTVD